MKLGYIPNKTVNDTNINKIKNSLLLTSLIFSSKNLLNEPPKATLLYKYTLYAADKMIDEQAKAPITGNLSKEPYRLRNSPAKFKVNGLPQFAKVSIKNKIESKGIIWARPL